MLANRVRMGSGGSSLLKPGDIVVYEGDDWNTREWMADWQKAFEIKVNAGGVVRVSFTHINNYTTTGRSTVELRINEINIKAWELTYGQQEDVVIDIPISEGDSIQIYGRITNSHTSRRMRINDFKILTDKPVPEGTFERVL